ncbi:hypothetical protein [Kaistia sp. MMO-174]|uniref:hypothetical protein n=1 Tax=Kaistia sp. MMO-174 TaxID=3081256 RepID=UPI00301737F5
MDEAKPEEATGEPQEAEQDLGPPAAVDPPEPPKKPVGLSEMAEVCMVEAIRITSTQEALIAAGYRIEAEPRQTRRAEVMEATAKFLDALAPHLPAIRQILKRPQGRA